MLYCNMQLPVYFYTSFILIKCNETLKHLMYCGRRISWLLLLFDKHFFNNLQISSEYSNTMLSFCKISLKKYNMLEADDRMFFLHNEFLLCMKMSNANVIEKPFICWYKFPPLSFNSKKHLLQCKNKYNDEAIKI